MQNVQIMVIQSHVTPVQATLNWRIILIFSRLYSWNCFIE